MCLPKQRRIAAYRKALLCRAFKRGCAVKPQTGVGLYTERKCTLPSCICRTVFFSLWQYENGRIYFSGEPMDYLQICAKAFERLLDIKYHIMIGRKGKLEELNLLFEPTEFHHLIGLHKLRDLRLSRGNREKVCWTVTNSSSGTTLNFNHFL